jgi:hypothetical protein
MVDIGHLAATPTVDDFVFHVGNDNTPAAWPVGPAPASVTVRKGTGVGTTITNGTISVVVPEPTSLGIVAVGTLGLILRRRRTLSDGEYVPAGNQA